jgi:hypothetical protein
MTGTASPAPNDMRRSLRIAAVTVIAATLLVTAAFVTTVRTYTTQVVAQGAHVIWNERQLVIFVESIHVGTSSTILQQVAYPATDWLGIRPFPPEQRKAYYTTILRVENGELQPPMQLQLAPAVALSSAAQRPRIVAGRMLVPGGFWNGREIEPLTAEEYLRVLRTSAAGDLEGWHIGGVLRNPPRDDLPVEVLGEPATLKASRAGPETSIDLVRAGAAPMRVFDVKAATHPVSAREYESTFRQTTDPPTATFFPR